MHTGTLVLAAVVAAGALARRSKLTTPVKLLAVLAVTALVVSGTGLVTLPSAEEMVRSSTGVLGSLTYLVVGAFALAETGAFVGLVAPGELVVVLGGVSAGHGTIALPVLVAVVWACALSGDLISYALGRRFGRSVLLAHGAGLGVTEERVDQLERVLSEHTVKTLVLGRFVGFVRPLTPFLSGAARIPARRFVPITTFASGLWSATFCCLGAAFWSSLNELVAIVERGSLALGATITVVALAVIVWRRTRGRTRSQTPAHRPAPASTDTARQTA